MNLNCDLGEGFGNWQTGCDEQVMPFIDLANIACGFHASDPLTMAKTVALALEQQVKIGAHPSYPDLVGFGRRSMVIAEPELQAIITYQIGALQGICQSLGAKVCYVKPHGALYNDMMTNIKIFETVCKAVASINAQLTLMIQAVPDSKPFQLIADKYQLPLWFEAFADRNYQQDGRLVSRNETNAVIEDEQEIVARCEHLLAIGSIKSVNGTSLSMKVDTLCVHGDNPSAIKIVSALRTLLDNNRADV